MVCVVGKSIIFVGYNKKCREMGADNRYRYALPVGFELKCGKDTYVIEEVLGKGGFGITYKVKGHVLHGNIPLPGVFAVKEYFPDKCWRDSDNAKMVIPRTMHDEITNGLADFINEGRKLQQVCQLDDSIVNVNEVFEGNGTAYYVLEYLSGGDLRKMVHDNGGRGISENQMLAVMVHVGHALQCIHDHKMLHLDVKPDNIVMSSATGIRIPKLIDFGISVHFDSKGLPTSKAPSLGITPGYSPIEQSYFIERFDPRIDVYAFSATCLYLLTGKDPNIAVNMTPEDVDNAIPSGTSACVRNAIVRGMSMMAKDRPASMTEMLMLLKGEDPPPPPKHKKKFWKKMLIVLSILLGVGLLAGLGLWGYKAFTSKKHRQDPEPVSENLTFNVNGVEFTMIAVEGGTFTMGATSEQGSDYDSDEKPTHSVTLDSYYIGETEVTQELWKAVMGDNQSYFNGNGSSFYGSSHNEDYGINLQRPVEYVSWQDCYEFIKRLNQLTGREFRLPTEAEWEYAARGGKSNGFKYSGSNNINDVAVYEVNSEDKDKNSPDYGPHSVKSMKPNELGIYDMSGNVCEWCLDYWMDEYSSGSQRNPVNYNKKSDSYNCCRRGGSWSFTAKGCRVSERSWENRGSRYNFLGLRLVLAPETKLEPIPKPEPKPEQKPDPDPMSKPVVDPPADQSK